MSNSMNGVVISKGVTGPNASDNEDGYSGLLFNAPVIAAVEGGVTGMANGTVYRITKLADAEAMGITAAWDTANSVRIHRHISEFYRMSKNTGLPLYLLSCAVAKTPKNMIEESGQTLLIAAEGKIRWLGLSYNPNTGYTPAYTDGIETNVREALAPFQTLRDWSWTNNMPLYGCIIEGRGLNGAVASNLNLRAITINSVVVEYGSVGVCIGQDYDYYEKLTGVHKNGADVGTFLGTRAGIAINRNVGEVETLDISDAKKGIWLTPALSNHSKISALFADLSDYDTKGYIFGMTYVGASGVRWNNDHTCAPETVDDAGKMNECNLRFSATMAKAAREIRKRLLPKVKSTPQVDATTGLLPTPTVKYFEGLGDSGLDVLKSGGEISGGATTVDPTSNLIVAPKELKVSFIVVPTGCINAIVGTINLKNSL